MLGERKKGETQEERKSSTGELKREGEINWSRATGDGDIMANEG